MKLKIDQLKCDTSGNCVKKYPQLFRFQEGSKKAEAIKENLPFHMEPECKCILDVCPVGAITIE